MDYKNYYDVLGVARDASADEIKRAYRKAARKYHPDVSKEADAEDRFKDASEAYEVLRDPEKRAAFDAIPEGGPPPRAGQQPGRSSGAAPDPSDFDFHGGGYTGGNAEDFSDFFESMFGRRAGARSAGPQPMRGQDQSTTIELDIEDAFNGSTQTITLRAPEMTDSGEITQRERTVKVNIPKGVRAGQQLRLSGQGAPGFGPGASAGDLYLEIAFRAHRVFRSDGNDLIVDLPVTPWEAALGASVKTPTPAGPVDLKIPAGSNAGRRMRLKARGMPGKTPGDLYVVLRITLPPAGSDGPADADRKLYEQMAEQMAFNPRAALGV